MRVPASCGLRGSLRPTSATLTQLTCACSTRHRCARPIAGRSRTSASPARAHGERGWQVVAAVEAIHTDLAERQVAVLCGRGNNGGDGFVVARTLLQRGVDTSVFLIGQVSEVRGDARVNLDILGRLGVTVVEIADGQAWELHFSEIEDCTLIIDAIFGTGLNAPLSGLMETVVADVNASGIQIVSIDLPSGLSADSHEPIGDSIQAGLTVTLGAPKLPLVLPPAETRAADIVIADIGIPAEVFESLEGPRVELLTPSSARELISPRTPDTHKGDYGRVLIVAGSRGKTGAAYLAALGALRLGAGLVTVATGASSQPVLADHGAGVHDRGHRRGAGHRWRARPRCRRLRAGTGTGCRRGRPWPRPGRVDA